MAVRRVPEALCPAPSLRVRARSAHPGVLSIASRARIVRACAVFLRVLERAIRHRVLAYRNPGVGAYRQVRPCVLMGSSDPGVMQLARIGTVHVGRWVDVDAAVDCDQPTFTTLHKVENGRGM